MKVCVVGPGLLSFLVASYFLSGGFEVKLAHPLKTKIIAEAKIKTDATDSKALAQLLRADLLPESYVPPKEIRELWS